LIFLVVVVVIYKNKVDVSNILVEMVTCNNTVDELFVLMEIEVTCNSMMEILHTLEGEICNGVEDAQHVLELMVTCSMGVCR
jgi:hypothetical protein